MKTGDEMLTFIVSAYLQLYLSDFVIQSDF